MTCPKCNSTRTQWKAIINIWRRCLDCKHRWPDLEESARRNAADAADMADYHRRFPDEAARLSAKMAAEDERGWQP
jgi:hypothetical protein